MLVAGIALLVLIMIISIIFSDIDYSAPIGLGIMIGLLLTTIAFTLMDFSPESLHDSYSIGQQDALAGHQHYKMEIHYKQDSIGYYNPADTTYIKIIK